METRSEILNRISLKKHNRHFNQLTGMQNRALVLQDALDEVLELVKNCDLADGGALHEIELKPVTGSSMCQYSVIENKLKTLYENQEKLLEAIRTEKQ